MNFKIAQTDAQAFGIKSYIENSRFKLEGKASEVRRVLAVQGLDIVANGTGVWSIETDGRLVGTLCSYSSDYGYFFSTQA